MQKRMVAAGIVACVVALVIAGLCIAQPPAGGGQRGQRREGFDPAQMQQRMAERRQRQMEAMREELQVDAEAWKVIEPRLSKVMELNMGQGMGGRGMGMMFGGRPGRAGGDVPIPGTRPQRDPNTMTPVEKALEQLRTTLNNESATSEEINKQLTSLRQAHENARRELAMAQAELQKILTPRQEAQLVLMGQLN